MAKKGSTSQSSLIGSGPPQKDTGPLYVQVQSPQEGTPGPLERPQSPSKGGPGISKVPGREGPWHEGGPVLARVRA
jgi:hypothetical protein